MQLDSTIKNWPRCRNIKVSGIYLIRNIINDKKYIGQSIDLRRRNYGHTTTLNRGEEHNPHLQNSWNKHGEENFTYKPILFCEKEELERYEIALIKLYKTQDRNYGYNVTPGGKSLWGKDHPMFGKHYSKEVREHYKRFGKRNFWYGKRPPCIDASVRATSIPVVQLDKQGNLIKRFNTITDAAKEIDVSKSSIARVCKGFQFNKGQGRVNRKTAGGYIWQHEKNYNAGIPVGG